MSQSTDWKIDYNDGENPETFTGTEAEARARAAQGLQDWADNISPVDSTVWLSARLEDETRITSVDLTVEPTEPACTEDEHDWEQVGLAGSGGGVIITEECRHCEVRRIEDTWAQDPATGEQGLTSIRYELTHA